MSFTSKFLPLLALNPAVVASEPLYSERMTTWVLLAGLPGVGKSTLALALKRRLGPHPSIALLDKDRIREAMFPGELTDYSTGQDELCARTMVEAARYLTQRGQVEWILFDGRTFSRQRQIDEVVQAAEQSGARWSVAHLICPPEIAEARIARPEPDHPAKNRGVDLYRRLRREFEPISREHVEIDTASTPDACAEQLWLYLSRRPGGQAR